MSAPNIYNGINKEEELPPTTHVFEAPSLAELRRWSTALDATSLADVLMATAQASPTAYFPCAAKLRLEEVGGACSEPQP